MTYRISRVVLSTPVSFQPDWRVDDIDLESPQCKRIVQGVREEGAWLVIDLVPGCAYLKARKMEEGSLAIHCSKVDHVFRVPVYPTAMPGQDDTVPMKRGPGRPPKAENA
jgi:hypothetical protein